VYEAEAKAEFESVRAREWIVREDRELGCGAGTGAGPKN
jgi:hypothetical protein